MAIKYYERVLEVLPIDPSASEELKQSLKNTALEKLKELKAPETIEGRSSVNSSTAL